MHNHHKLSIMVFFSDLDKTLIYSQRASGVCIERLDGRDICYMAEPAYDILMQLISTKGFYFIPCTLRSLEQTSRITFIDEKCTPYLICDNGFSLYHKMKLDTEWDKKMSDLIDLNGNRQFHNELMRFMQKDGIPVKQIKSNRDAFYTIIFETATQAESYSKRIMNLINTAIYKTSLQGRKFYIIPQKLDKSTAVEHLSRLIPYEIMVTAGDSEVDEQFIQLGHYSFIPAHSSLKIPGAMMTTHSGIESSTEILFKIKDLFSSKNHSY